MSVTYSICDDRTDIDSNLNCKWKMKSNQDWFNNDDFKVKE